MEKKQLGIFTHSFNYSAKLTNMTTITIYNKGDINVHKLFKSSLLSKFNLLRIILSTKLYFASSYIHKF